MRRSPFERVIAYLITGGFTFFAAFPVLWALNISLKFEKDIITRRFTFWPNPATLTNYVAIWTQSNLPDLMWNSAVTTFFTVGICDTRIGLALAYTAFLLPIFIWMMKGFFDAIPSELEEAAQIDGCTRLGAMVRVVLPLVQGGLWACAVFIGIAAWNEYLFALMLTTSSGSRTWPVGLQLMVGEFQLPWGALTAGGILSILPVLALFAIVQRSMVRGLAQGAVKG